MKDSLLNEKLKRYPGLTSCLLIVTNLVQAQVIYTDVDPDITIWDGTYELDMNNDGIVDYTIIGHFSSDSWFQYGFVLAKPTTDNSIAFASGYPKVCEYGDTINSLLLWADFSGQTLGFHSYVSTYSNSCVCTAYGAWLNQSEKYLGLRFTFNGEKHYGWARLSVAWNATHFTIHDYAYAALSDSAIIIESIPVSIENILVQNFCSIFPNPSDGLVTVSASFNHEESLTIKVLDLRGKELYSERLRNITGTFSKQLDLSNFSQGTYLLELIHNGQREVKKLVIQK